MRGILRKIVREIWLATLLFSTAFLLVEVLMNLMLPQMMAGQPRVIPVSQLASLSQASSMGKLMSVLLGLRIEAEGSEIVFAHLMQAWVWFHPVVFAILGAHVALVCTRFPVAEIDRGTVDVLLSLPVSRRAVYLCETIGWLASGLILLVAGATGHAIGTQALAAADRLGLEVVLLILFNLLCMYIAVGGLAFLVSSLSERRGRAVAGIFGLMLSWYLIDVLAVFWSPVQDFAFLSLLHYYRPMAIMQTGAIPASHVVTLLTVGAVGWIAGCEVSARRSICTI